MSSKFLAQVAKCPFCGNRIEQPKEMEPRRLGDFSYGSCMCGAVYVCDETGHNIGSAMIEALGFACKDDWDLAWALMPDEDYKDAQIEKYDLQTNMIYPSGKTSDGRFVRGVLVFIRLNDDILEAQGQRFIPEHSVPKVTSKTSSRSKEIKRRFKKSEVEKLVRECNTEKLCEMALQDSLVLRKIQRLLYSADETIRWNAILCLGKSAGALVKLKPEVVGDLVRRLLYAANDSAAASWGALEAVGEIIRWSADVFGSFVRHMLAMLRDPQLRPSVLWSAGRIGQRHPELIKNSAFFAIFDCLQDQDPQVRGYAIWTLGNIKAKEAKNSINRLTNDTNKIKIFDGQKNIETTVGNLAKEALKKIEDLYKENSMESQKNNQKLTKKDNSDEQTKQDPLAMAYQLYREADLAKTRGMSLEAMDKYKEALPIFEYYKKEVEIANCCEKLADVLLMRGDFKGALPLYQRAMAICEKKNDSISLLILIEKVIDIYRHFKDQEKLLTYLFRALELCEQLKEASRAGLYLTTIGDIYQKQGRLDDALDAYKVALKLYKGMKSRERVEILQKGIAEIEAQLIKED